MNRRAIISTRGITLLEIILVMVIMGILAGIIVAPVITGSKAWSDMTRQNEVSQQARIGLDRFGREARAIRRVSGRPSLMVNWTEGVTPVTIGPSRIRFFTSSGEDLEYSWAGAGQPLVRTDWSSGAAVTDPAAMNVQNFSLCYYEDSNASLTQNAPDACAVPPSPAIPIGQIRQEAELTPPAPNEIVCNPAPCTVDSGLVVLDQPGATITFKFRGTGVVWVGPKATDLGIATVVLDTNPPGGWPGGGPIFTDTVDLYSATDSTGQLLYSSPASVSTPLAYGPYQLTIGFNDAQNIASTGKTVTADAFDLLVNRVVVGLTVGEGACNANLCTTLRDQISFRSVQ